MTNPFTSIFAQPDLWILTKLNSRCPISHRVCHDEIEMWVDDKPKDTTTVTFKPSPAL